MASLWWSMRDKCFTVCIITAGDPERASEVFLEASPRQNSPAPSPTAHQEQPYFKVSSRFESEMKEANEIKTEHNEANKQLDEKKVDDNDKK